MGIDIYCSGKIVAVLNYKELCKKLNVDIKTDKKDIIELLRQDANFEDYKFKYMCLFCNKKVKGVGVCGFKDCFCLFCENCDICTAEHKSKDIGFEGICICGDKMNFECEECYSPSCGKCKMCNECYYMKNGKRENKKNINKIPSSLNLVIDSCNPGGYKQFSGKDEISISGSDIFKLEQKYNADIVLKVAYDVS